MMTLMLLVFLLGVRHGFEPDHLALIDGMTRYARIGSKLAQWTGFLFSLGHGLVIILVTIIIGISAEKWNVPMWFAGLGTWISIVSLFFIGVVNLYSTLKINQENKMIVSRPSSIWLNKIIKSNPVNTSYWGPILLGILFSLSFDTLSQTMAFSFSAYTLAGRMFPVLLGTVFMIGMMMTDGLNGYIVARIIKSASQKSKIISKVFGLLIGGFSFAISIYYIVMYFKL